MGYLDVSRERRKDAGLDDQKGMRSVAGWERTRETWWEKAFAPGARTCFLGHLVQVPPTLQYSRSGHT